MTDETILLEARSAIQKEINGLQKMQSALDQSFIRAVRVLFESEKIIVCGLGKSGIIGQKIAATLTSVGKTSLFLHPVEALHGDIGVITPHRDAVMLLSNSGSTAEILRLIPHIRKRHVPIVTLAGMMNSPLVRLSDISLDCGVAEEIVRDFAVPTASSTATLAMGDAIAVALIMLAEFSSKDFADRHPLGQIGRNLLLTVADIMHVGNNLPSVHPQASFRDALIEISDKGLGCVCVIDDDKKLVGIITDGDVRRRLQTADDIRAMNVADCMTKNPLCVSPDATLGIALGLMENRPKQLSVLPVADDNGRCLGIVRIHDIVRVEL